MYGRNLIAVLLAAALAGAGAEAANQLVTGKDGHQLLLVGSLDHLEPLDARGIDLYQGFSAFLAAVTPKHDYELSAIYIWPSFKPSTFLAIYQTQDEKDYYLLYALTTKPEPTVVKVDLPAAFAKEFSENLEIVIRHQTRYEPEGVGPIRCTDATEYVFESGDYYGAAGCPVEGQAQQLIDVAEQLVEVARLKTASRGEQDEAMHAALSHLKALSK